MPIVTEERRRDLWYLATSGLLRLKLGLVNFVKTHIKVCHLDFLENLAISIGLSSATEIDGTGPTWIQDIDVNKRFYCQTHETYDIKICERQCPNASRQKLLDEIKNLHRQKKPIWKNTHINPSQWICNTWEFAKCFLSVAGYQHVNSIEELDPSGVLSIMINLIPIAKKLNINEDDIKKGNDVLSQVISSDKAILLSMVNIDCNCTCLFLIDSLYLFNKLSNDFLKGAGPNLSMVKL